MINFANFSDDQHHERFDYQNIVYFNFLCGRSTRKIDNDNISRRKGNKTQIIVFTYVATFDLPIALGI